VRPAGPTFFLLDERTGWRRGHSVGVTEDRRGGLRLTADPNGVRSLARSDGSLGGLVLPEYVAVDGAGALFVLAPSPPFLRRFDPASGNFVPLPATGAPGVGPRRLGAPAAIAAAGRNLLVADPGNRQVAVFDTPTLALRAVWGPRDGTGRPTDPNASAVWKPLSVAVGPSGGYVLDAAYGIVYRHRTPLTPPELVAPSRPGVRCAGRPPSRDTWRRLAVGRSGRLYLLRRDAPLLDVYEPGGTFVDTADDPGVVADDFEPPPVTADHRGRIRIPVGLLAACPWLAPDGEGGAWFDPATGRPARFDPDEWTGPPEFVTTGTWISQPLDSQIYRCQWHRIQLDVGQLPTGTRLGIATYTDGEERALEEILALPAHLWSKVPDVVGPAAQAPRANPPAVRGDAAVLSREGRYLWLRLKLQGDGHGTPIVAAGRVHYPRRSHLELLPSIYAADDTARRFLERFLSILQTRLEPVEEAIHDYPAHFDPDAANPAMVDVLSTWLGLPTEGDWGSEQRRNLLRVIPASLRRHGTPAGMRTYVQAYLENITGLRLPPGHFPHIVEGYRERNHLSLTGGKAVGPGMTFWGPGKVARLQLDRFATEGHVRLVSTGDPDRDVFHYYAHRFRVVIPAAWVRTATEERMVRRAIEAEKPAHTDYELALLTPGVSVGRQSTVGVDTVIGSVPRARLACRHDANAAPSRPPRGRLGVDTVLCAGPRRSRNPRLTARVGADTTLI
jgi:phage tail-like protein